MAANLDEIPPYQAPPWALFSHLLMDPPQACTGGQGVQLLPASTGRKLWEAEDSIVDAMSAPTIPKEVLLSLDLPESMIRVWGGILSEPRMVLYRPRTSPSGQRAPHSPKTKSEHTGIPLPNGIFLSSFVIPFFYCEKTLL